MTQLKALKIALLIIGLVFIIAIMPLMEIWPSGWSWEPRHYEYEQMILGIYATLGVFLLIASRNPLAHRSLIQFTIWSSVVHATIMLFQAMYDKAEHMHLAGDVPALYLIAVVLFFLLPKAQ